MSPCPRPTTWRPEPEGCILVTGSAGLVGRVLCRALAAAGFHVRGLDLRDGGAWQGDVRDPHRLDRALAGCDGVVHLAAVSRVLAAERDPDLCWQTNVQALHTLLGCVCDRPYPPWLVFASSREVYGNAPAMPVPEGSPPRPGNAYAWSKLAGEALVTAAARNGLRAMTVRLSNVYGRVEDHPDRVVPAFARAAAAGQPMRVDGPSHGFDFTQVDDVARGLVGLVRHLAAGGPAWAPVHFVSGRCTTLGALADLANRLAAGRSVVWPGPPSDLHAHHFVGDPARARVLLGWQARCDIATGLARLIDDFRRQRLAGEGAPGPRHRAGVDGVQAAASGPLG